ncbi:alpha/beta fold hydrolase [Modestobacter excelsi]|uniref:alpha/beta fold hydrolase n=1 Tax=Modestobacter excelsi TaxID=2213161 RepID=UPI00110CF9B3|nr:alpha/beta hydrolase [Modestobacter excelsi]
MAAVGEAPAWFRRAVSERPGHRELEFGTTRLHYRTWGDPSLPGLVLVHGAGANSSWWDHLAPLITTHHVIAPDLSGHGDSDHRTSYDLRSWAGEISAITAAEGLDRPIIAGHSLGGWVAVTLASETREAVSGLVLIDSPLRRDASAEQSLPHQRRRLHRVYPSTDQAIERFRTLPHQQAVLPYVRRHIAAESLAAVDGGWTWKFDPFVVGRQPPLPDAFTRLTCRTALFYCERGLVNREMAAEMQRLVRGPFRTAELPDAGHHPMLDQPLVLVTALTTLLQMWLPPW